MSTDANKELVRRFINEAINTGNIEIINDFVAPNYTEIHEGTKYPIGIEGAKEHIIGVRQTYPDLHLTIDNQIAEGEWVATCITARGTHKGVWLNIKPTGKILTYTGVNVDRVVNGRIVEHGGATNLLGPLIDAGALKIVKADDDN